MNPRRSLAQLIYITKYILKTIEKNFPKIAKASYETMKNIIYNNTKITDKVNYFAILYNKLVELYHADIKNNKKKLHKPKINTKCSAPLCRSRSKIYKTKQRKFKTLPRKHYLN